MLKAKFIDKILEVMQEEADEILITKRDVDIYYKATKKDDDGTEDISALIESLDLSKQVGEYKIYINYQFENIEILKGNKFVCLRGFGRYRGTGIWTMIMEEIEKDKVKNNGD